MDTSSRPRSTATHENSAARDRRPSNAAKAIASQSGEEILVIGYGNALREDDGLGLLIVEQVATWQIPHVRTLTITQLTPELAAELATATVAVFVDACIGPCETPVVMKPVAPGGSSWSLAHTLEPPQLLAMANALYGHVPQAWSVHVLGERFGIGENLSEPARRYAAEAVEAIRNLLCRTEPRVTAHLEAVLQLPRENERTLGT